MFQFTPPHALRWCRVIDHPESTSILIVGAAIEQGLARYPSFLEEALKAHPQMVLWHRLGMVGDKTPQPFFLELPEQVLFIVPFPVDETAPVRIRALFAAAMATWFTRVKSGRLQFTLPPLEDALACYALEGILLGQDPSDQKCPRLLDSITWVEQTQPERGAELETLLRLKVEEASAWLLCRRLVNANADQISPQGLTLKVSEWVEGLQERLRQNHAFGQLSFEVIDAKAHGFGLLEAVGRGATEPARMLVLSYTPEGSSKDPIVLVGKGITYDTGGLKLKPGDSMVKMRQDMAGAAVALAVYQLAALEQLPHPLVVVIPCAENAISASSYKMGDVYCSYGGLSVEITNTDAEGRLVVAEGCEYASRRFTPQAIIDLGTFTGGALAALGHHAACLMGHDERLLSSLEKAGRRTGERLCRLPLYPEYQEYLRSDVADLTNCGPAGVASSLVAASFIERFVPPGLPWAHIDIAGVAFFDRSRGFFPKLATGFGVRLLIEWLREYGQATPL